MAPSPAGVNPHAQQPTSLPALARSLWRNRLLIAQMTRREVVGRYNRHHRHGDNVSCAGFLRRTHTGCAVADPECGAGFLP